MARLFDPTNPVPAIITDVTKVDRGYLPAPLGANVQLLETFSQPTGTSDQGVPTTAVGVKVKHQAASFEHQTGTRVATVSWGSALAQRYFQVNFAPGKNVSPFQALSFRTALKCFGAICNRAASQSGEMTYGVSLVDTSGRMSNVYNVIREVRISRPIGPDSFTLHSTLYTVEIPFSTFRGVDLNNIKGVRFTFERRQNGLLDIADLALLKNDPLSTGTAPSVDIASGKQVTMASAIGRSTPIASPSASADGNTLKIVRGASAGGAATSSAASEATVDIVLSSKRSFPITNAFPKMTVGDTVIEGGSVGADGKTMTISVPAATFARLAPGTNVSLFVQASSPVWLFGPLPK